ncbi:MAG: hypothetical protein ACFE9I_08140 [Candidatus Hermodarchaeota archaeon]
MKNKEIENDEFENSNLINQNRAINDIKDKIIRIINDDKSIAELEETKGIQKAVKVKTTVIEQDEKQELKILSLISEKDESLKIPLSLKEEVERIILKILYDEKSVKSLKLFIEKVLERAMEKKITISEKSISLIIYQMDNDKKIQFTQREGWKIRI